MPSVFVVRETLGLARPLPHAYSVEFFDLRILQFDRGTPTENIDQHLQARMLFINVLNRAFKRLEMSINNFNLLANFEKHRLHRSFFGGGNFPDNAFYLSFTNRQRLIGRPQKTRNFRCILDQ